jgi:ornithine--oxo-acid transaminase
MLTNDCLKNTQDYVLLEEKLGARNYNPLDIVIDKAEGVWVYDIEGKKYLDCLSAYSSVNQGHCHPEILKVLKEQAEKVTLTSRAFRNSQLPLFYQKLIEVTGVEMVLPMNTGAEAVETAIKAARKWGYKVKGIPNDKAEIIVCENNFHGRTTTIVGFSSEHSYKDGFGPYSDGFTIIPYGDINAFKNAITPNTCAFLLEPIQGEAGVIIPPDGYLKAIEKICKENNILLMLDEIQTGFGRTGKMFAFQYENINPDVIIVGKALSGGFYPVSAVLARKDILSVFNPGEHGSTFGGNPLGCAVAIAALNVLVNENLVQKSLELGKFFISELRQLKNPHIAEIRGRGLFIGLEFDIPVRPYCEKLKEEGVLCKDTHSKVLRIAPPLVISKEEIKWALNIISKVIG